MVLNCWLRLDGFVFWKDLVGFFFVENLGMFCIIELLRKVLEGVLVGVYDVFVGGGFVGVVVGFFLGVKSELCGFFFGVRGVGFEGGGFELGMKNWFVIVGFGDEFWGV